jgi:ribosome-binding ATPase YchF (GTP1/OBG family)
VLLQYKDALESGQNARSLEVSKEDKEAIADLHLLTIKPVIYAANVDEASIHTGNNYVEALKKAVAPENAQVLCMCCPGIAIAEIADPEERQMFLEENG